MGHCSLIGSWGWCHCRFFCLGTISERYLFLPFSKPEMQSNRASPVVWYSYNAKQLDLLSGGL